jgi:phage FluMu protein gp41
LPEYRGADAQPEREHEEVSVADVLIRGLSVAAVARIDADAAARGLSPQEYLRRRFEAEGAITPPHRRARLTAEDLDRAAAAATDLDDAAMMRKAWG